MKDKIISPKVTVLMPVYNSEKYLKEAIDSILAQTFTDFEFLIIDDGSTDSSLDIISSYQDDRIIISRYKKNAGIVTRLNQGLKMARGKYIARMDADDISLLQRLEKQVSFMDSHPNVGVCGTWVSFFTKIPWVGSKYCPIGDSNIIKAKLIFENVIQHPSVMIKRALIIKNGYPNSFPFAEDYALWIDLIEKTDFVILPEILLNYRLHSLQIGQINSVAQTQDVAGVHKIIFDKLRIDCSKEELKLHEKLCFGNYEFSREFINKVDKWFVKIQNSNKTAKVFENKTLKIVLSSRWLSACVMHTRLKHWIWKRYWQSKFVNVFTENKWRIRQLWWESTFIPTLRPYLMNVKKHPFIKKILLG